MSKSALPDPASADPARARLRIVSIDDPQFVGGASVGDTLRAARLRANMTLDEASAATKVKGHYLQALEDMDPRVLPERAYAIGFLKAYASVLGLDADLLAARYKVETEAPVDVPTDGFDVMGKSFSIPRGARIAIVLISIAVAFTTWRGFKTPSDPAPEPQPAEWAPDVYAAPAGDPFVLSAPTAAPDQPVTAPDGAAMKANLVLRASADVELTVRDATGRVVFSRALASGALYTVPDQTGLRATVNKPGVLEAIVDGQPMGKISAATVDLDALR